MILVRLTFILFCLVASVAAAQQWSKVTSDNFDIYGDVETTVLHELASDLEIFRYFLTRITALDHVKPTARVPIFILSRRQDFDRVTRLDSSSNGIYAVNQRGPVFVVHTRGLSGDGQMDGRTLLLHEYVHHFMRQFSALRYPRWYDEGFAEFLSTFQHQGGMVTVGAAAVHRLALLVATEWLPLDQLLNASAEFFEGGNYDNNFLYAQGWYVTHFFQTEPGYRPKLANYIQRINQGESNEQAFQAAFDQSYEQVDGKIQARWQTELLPYAQLDLSAGLSTFELSVEQLEGVDAQLVLPMAKLHFAGTQEPVWLSRQADKVLKRRPAHWQALVLSAEAELGRGRLKRADERILTLLQEYPQRPEGLALRGARLLMGGRDSAPGDEAIVRARELLLEAIAMDPYYPQAHFWLLESYRSGPLDDITELDQVIAQAQLLIPHYSELELAEADIYLRLRQYDRAQRLVEFLLPWSDNPGPLRKRLRLIEKRRPNKE